MRIDAYNQITQLYGVQKNLTTRKTTNTTAGRDQLSISQAGKDYQVAKSAVSQASDIREDKIATLKSRLDSGNYQVEAGDFASKLLEKYNALV